MKHKDINIHHNTKKNKKSININLGIKKRKIEQNFNE